MSDNDQLIRHLGVWQGLELEYSWGHYAVYCGGAEDATLVEYFGGDDYGVIKRFAGETAIHDAIRECDDQYSASLDLTMLHVGIMLRVSTQ